MSDASRRGRNNRRKGGEYEAELARRFTAAGIPATKEGHKQRRAQDREADVHAGPFRVEGKDKLALNPHKVLAEHAAKSEEGIPVLVWKRPRKIEDGKQKHPKSEIVAMRLEDFLGLAVVFARIKRIAANNGPDLTRLPKGADLYDPEGV